MPRDRDATRTAVWPTRDVWTGAVLFLETSEEAPSPLHVRQWLRSYGVQGILKRVAAIDCDARTFSITEPAVV